MLTTCAFRSAVGIGYVQINVSQGDNLISNPLNTTDNRLSTIFRYSSPPDNSTVALWDPVLQQFSTPSVYSQGSGWTIDYYLPLGVGALFKTPSDGTITFIGEVDLNTRPTEYGGGTFLLSSITPFNPAPFEQVLRRYPMEGESVRRLDAASQTYTVSTFRSEDWDNGAPDLAVGHSAFYTLVPEPGTFGLVAMGLAGLVAARWAGSGRSRRGGWKRALPPADRTRAVDFIVGP